METLKQVQGDEIALKKNYGVAFFSFTIDFNSSSDFFLKRKIDSEKSIEIYKSINLSQFSRRQLLYYFLNPDRNQFGLSKVRSIPPDLQELFSRLYFFRQ